MLSKGTATALWPVPHRENAKWQWLSRIGWADNYPHIEQKCNSLQGLQQLVRPPSQHTYSRLGGPLKKNILTFHLEVSKRFSYFSIWRFLPSCFAFSPLADRLMLRCWCLQGRTCSPWVPGERFPWQQPPRENPLDIRLLLQLLLRLRGEPDWVLSIQIKSIPVERAGLSTKISKMLRFSFCCSV